MPYAKFQLSSQNLTMNSSIIFDGLTMVLVSGFATQILLSTKSAGKNFRTLQTLEKSPSKSATAPAWSTPLTSTSQSRTEKSKLGFLKNETSISIYFCTPITPNEFSSALSLEWSVASTILTKKSTYLQRYKFFNQQAHDWGYTPNYLRLIFKAAIISYAIPQLQKMNQHNQNSLFSPLLPPLWYI